MGQVAKQEAREVAYLVASGYEWYCPECETVNNEIRLTETVKCRECGKVFETLAYHALD